MPDSSRAPFFILPSYYMSNSPQPIIEADGQFNDAYVTAIRRAVTLGMPNLVPHGIDQTARRIHEQEKASQQIQVAEPEEEG